MMQFLKNIWALIYVFGILNSQAQKFTRESTIGLQAGMINYQGDLKPSSFSFNHPNVTASLVYRKPLGKLFSLRTGIQFGKIEGADKYNRDYLKPRNLSFFNKIKEISLGVEINLFDITKRRFSPYINGGITVFHMNPWAYDASGEKIYLKPLSTEGQGLPEYPEQKEYSLLQNSLQFGGGIKYVINNAVIIGLEFNQRKTFTDYLDDVSSFYVDRDILLNSKGPKAVEMAFRGNELDDMTINYPGEYHQRGTQSEKDWYYLLVATVQFKFSAIANLFSNKTRKHYQLYGIPCPKK